MTTHIDLYVTCNIMSDYIRIQYAEHEWGTVCSHVEPNSISTWCQTNFPKCAYMLRDDLCLMYTCGIVKTELRINASDGTFLNREDYRLVQAMHMYLASLEYNVQQSSDADLRVVYML